jgi:single-strand DNA-binding protein
MTMSRDVDGETEFNRVTLRGRVSAEPSVRELPSGTSIVTFRMIMTRAKTHMTGGSKQTSDWVDCVAWAPRPRRTVATWRSGDTVEVEGALRRRFFRSEGGVPSSRVEVEVLTARVVSRAG